MAVLENAQAPKSYMVKLDLDEDIKVVNLSDGGAVFVGSENLVVGSILAPWALDALGQVVPITQTVTATSITITVDTSSVTAWPVIADPAYHTFQCHSHNLVTTTGTASQYLNGLRCPRYEDITARGYYPEWIKHFNRWRVGDRNGECSFTAERKTTLLGVIFDFTQACQTHDYCYDLGAASRLNYSHVKKTDCDQIFRDDMFYDCSNRSLHNRPDCWYYANIYFVGVKACPIIKCFS